MSQTSYPPQLRVNFWRAIALLLGAVGGVAAAAAAEPVSARAGTIELPTYPWAAVRHPYFPATDKLNIYPYPMLDFLSRDRTNQTYRTVVLENEFLRITFLPQLGGKIQEVLDKTTGQPMFYVNHVVKPGLIGQCGGWTSGGVEWNTGPQGHTVGCLQPVPVEILPPEKDGSRSVAIGETERIYGTKWTVVVTLRPGRSFIEERIRIYNPTEFVRPYYFWNCTAVPNTHGFRFIYPMTLGMDHSGEKFFHWPIHEGRDLTRGTNYQDAASIFAFHCDQDFFGSYNEDLNHGVVSFANHHQLPGKKAWTWGHGSYGTMHQADLTDSDGPYNEVQTGPLLTQGEVGRLEPCEAVEWNEWWYPVHELGGFMFANRDVAVNVSRQGSEWLVRLLGTGTWKDVQVKLDKGRQVLGTRQGSLSPRLCTELRFDLGSEPEPFELDVRAGRVQLAHFRVPLELPPREQPAKKPAPSSASELVQDGWQHWLFARFNEAEGQFRKALEKDANNPEANIGLAYLNLDREPAAAVGAANAALAAAPDSGRAHYVLAAAADRLGRKAEALEQAWLAALDPSTAVAARALIAKVLIRRQDYAGAGAVLSTTGPWSEDPLCRNLRAEAALRGQEQGAELGGSRGAPQSNLLLAARLAKGSLELDPLDAFAHDLLVRTGLESAAQRAAWQSIGVGNRQMLLELVADYSGLGDNAAAVDVLPELCAGPPELYPLERYWLTYLQRASTIPGAARHSVPRFRGESAAAWRARVQSGAPYLPKSPGPRDARSASTAFPYRLEMLPVLRWALEQNPNDGTAALYLGHLLFHLGRQVEGRAMWERAAKLGPEPVFAYRALGLAAKTLDNDLELAHRWLEQACQADPLDAIVARDLANVLFALADKSTVDAERRALNLEARTRLQAAFENGKGRSDFVALLARAHNELREYAASARMLDQVRVTIWEGAHEVHDLFEQAHLALGEAALQAGLPAQALAEFDRALEYPANLATGKLEDTSTAQVQYARGQALAALGRKAEARAAWEHAANEPSKDSKNESIRQKAREALAQPQP